MGNQMRYLSKPITDCYFETGAGKYYSYTAASMQGWRKYQEDRFICLPDFSEDCGFFGVYDGHGGSEIAEFLRQRLHFEVMHSLQTQDDVELALHLGFLSCDASIMEPENIAELNDMVEEENRGTVLQILKNQPSLEAAMSQAGEDHQSTPGEDRQSKPAEDRQSKPGKDRPCWPDEYNPSRRVEVHRSRPGRCGSPISPPASTSAPPLFPAPDAAPRTMCNFQLMAEAGIQQFLFHNTPGPSEESIIAQIQQRQQQLQQESEEEEMMEVERPLDYLLSDDIEPSDPEDEDYNIEEDEESSSTESEDETNCISTEEFLNSEPGYLSGSTATVAMIRQNRLYVANVGDSRCVLSRKGQAIDMSLDHKPDDPEEHARIIGAGGSVSEDGRVDNCLNLSRAFGDFKFKGDSSVPSQQCITAEPFIKSVDIEKDDDFLIIASDGIWNSMSSQEVVDYINIRLKAGDSDLKNICEELFKFTLATDKDNDGTGCDNMCCIIIRFSHKGDSSFIYKAGASNEVMSSDDSLKQEEKNVNVPTSGGAEQTTANISEKISPVDEKNCHQNSHDLLLEALCPKQSIHHSLNSHWVDLSSQQEKRSGNLILKSLILKNTHSKDLFPGIQIKGIGNLAGSSCKISLPLASEKQDLCNEYPSNIFKNPRHPNTVGC